MIKVIGNSCIRYRYVPICKNSFVLFLFSFLASVSAADKSIKAAGILVTTQVNGVPYLCLGQLKYGLKSWIDFGGFCDKKDASLIETAQRECFEESGLQLSLGANTPCVINKRKKYCMFACHVEYEVLKNHFNNYDTFIAEHQKKEGFDEHREFALIPLSLFVEKMDGKPKAKITTLVLFVNDRKQRYHVRSHFFDSLALWYKENASFVKTSLDQQPEIIFLWQKK